jgi:hypothetical protein
MTQFEWPNRSIYFKRHTTAKTAALDHNFLRSGLVAPNAGPVIVKVLFALMTHESGPWAASTVPTTLSSVLAYLEVDDDAEMIASPDPINRLVEGECGGADVAVRMRVSVP